MAKKTESGVALKRMMQQAEAMDERRQRQIKQQAVRIDNMKLIIQELAGEVRELEQEAYPGTENGTDPRSVDKIIADAVERAN